MEDFVMDFEAIKKAAQGYQADMSNFLRAMISVPAKYLRIGHSHRVEGAKGGPYFVGPRHGADLCVSLF